MKLVWSLKYSVWYSIYSVVVKYSKVMVVVGENRYSKLRSQANVTHSNISCNIIKVRLELTTTSTTTTNTAADATTNNNSNNNNYY